MHKATTIILFAALMMAACRGAEKKAPPIHLNRNMDYQERFDAQEANAFFADNRSMRMPVPGTVARGMLRDDVRFYEGRTADGAFVDGLPIPTTMELLERGRERFDIFCALCHGGSGDGEGIITSGNYGFTPAPTFHDDRLRGESDGHMYNVIANGVRTMPAYGHQIPVADRWAIVAYIRALQRSQYASESDIPAGIRAQIQQGAGQGAAAAEDTTSQEGEGDDAMQEAEGGDADTTAQEPGDND